MAEKGANIMKTLDGPWEHGMCDIDAKACVTCCFCNPCVRAGIHQKLDSPWGIPGGPVGCLFSCCCPCAALIIHGEVMKEKGGLKEDGILMIAKVCCLAPCYNYQVFRQAQDKHGLPIHDPVEALLAVPKILQNTM